MYKLTKFWVGELTPSVAAELLKDNTYIGQRVMKPWKLRVISSRIQDGTFRTGAVAMASNGIGRVMVNGQHCSTSVVNTGETIPAAFEEYSYETELDLAKLFSTFDDKIVARTDSEVNKTFANAARLSDLPSQCQAICTKGLSKWLYGGSVTSQAQKAMLMVQHKPECRFIHDLLYGEDRASNKVPEHLSGKAVITATMLETWKASPLDAANFWRMVRDGLGVGVKGDPTYMLREWLVALRAKTAGGGKKVKDEEIRVKCLHAWNAFRSNRTLSSLRYYREGERRVVAK